MVRHFRLDRHEIRRHQGGNTIVLVSGETTYYDLLTDAFWENHFGPIFAARSKDYGWGFFINGLDDEGQTQVESLLEKFQEWVYIDNALHQTFALDYHFADEGRSETGELVYRAKYKHDKNSTLQLIDALADFIEYNPSYSCADYIASVPSYPPKPYDLPKFLAGGLGVRFNIENGQHLIQKIRQTEPMKDLNTEEEKFNNIRGAFQIVESEQVRGKRIIIVDDLIRSGMTLHELGMELRRAGATVLGLAATKTIRD